MKANVKKTTAKVSSVEDRRTARDNEVAERRARVREIMDSQLGDDEYRYSKAGECECCWSAAATIFIPPPQDLDAPARAICLPCLLESIDQVHSHYGRCLVSTAEKAKAG